MKRFAILFLTGFSLTAPAFAQREFLTGDEIEKIREAQDPNVRLQTYVLFARQRLDQLQQLIAKDKKGRSLLVRQLLGDYVQIIDAIDTVSDDALKRKADIAIGTAAVAEAEQKFLALLKKIADSQPHDLDMYDVALKDAIGDTGDSLETTRLDAGKRSEAVTAKADKEKKEVESLTSRKELHEQKVEDARAEDGKPQRKAPTLYRPGEKPTQPN